MKKEVQIALFAGITLALSIWGYKFISGKNLFSANYTYHAFYTDVHDVNTATPVQINGYEVGTVISISPDPQDVQRIRIDFTVKNEIKLPNYTIALLKPSSALGGKVIELDFDKMCVENNCAEDKSELKGVTVGIIGSLINQKELQGSMEVITSVIDSTLRGLGNPDSQDAVDVGIRNLATTLENLATITQQFNSLMANSSRNMEKTLDNISVLTGTLVKSNTKVNKMLEDLSKVTSDLKEVKLSETIKGANGTLDQAETTLKTAESTMTAANTTLSELNEILAKISEGEGTVGKLMHDDQLYNNIEATTKNLDLLIQDIRLNPRRYFRLFGKKSREYEYPEVDPALIEEDK